MSQFEIELLAIAAVALAVYWFLIRPRLEGRSHKREIESLQIGDEVLTTGGFLGTVKEVHIPESGPVQIVIDFGNGFEVHALASAIAQRVRQGQTVHSSSLAHREEKQG